MHPKVFAFLKSASWSLGTCLLGIASYPLGHLMAFLFSFTYDGDKLITDGGMLLLGIAIVGASFLDYALAGKEIEFPKRRGLALGFIGFILLLLDIVSYAAVTTLHPHRRLQVALALVSVLFATIMKYFLFTYKIDIDQDG